MGNVRKLATAALAALFCSAALFARQGGDGAGRPLEVGFGFRLVEAPAGLLGDLTNISPSFGGCIDIVPHIKKDRLALRGRFFYDSWAGKSSHEFRGTDGHRVTTGRLGCTLGLMLLLGHRDDPDSAGGVCFDVGASRWLIDSSTYPPLKGNDYERPAVGVQYVGAYKGSWWEIGVEACFLKTDNIGFKDYGRASYALTLALGTRLDAVRRK